jgi:hypothetical protein
VSEPIAPPEWGRLADLQQCLRSLDSGGDPSAVEESAGRGIRLRLARLALEEIIRWESAERARRHREDLERALDGFVERAARASAPRAAAARKPVKPGRAAPRRPRLPQAPLPEFWSPQAVLGFRLWEMRHRLHGVWQTWDHPFREARCVSGRTERDDGEVPHTDGRCGYPPCGIYAFKEPVDLLGAFDLPGGSRRYVYGLVELSGKVVEHARGYRGQRAAVVAAAVVGKGWLMRVEGKAQLQALFSAPEEAVAALTEADPSVVEETGGREQTTAALIAYLTLARDFWQLTAT